MKKLLIYSLVLFCISCGNTEKTEPKLSDFCGQEVKTHRVSGPCHESVWLGFLRKDGSIMDVKVNESTFNFYKDGDIILCDSTNKLNLK